MATHPPTDQPASQAINPSTGSPTDSCVDLWTTRQPGTYLLLIQLTEPATLEIGRFGRVALPAGWYVYIGSALSGLGARVSRHARQEKRPHWHIDRLLGAGQLVTVVARIGPERIECRTAASIIALPDATLPVPRFGASDCRCPAHLVHVPARPDLTLGPEWQTASPLPPT